MREILFRGKHKNGNRWVKGSIIQNKDAVFIAEKEEYSFAQFCRYCQSPYRNIYRVIPETVGQYTGLTDKNGKKIFEGDIVEYDGMRAVVEWDSLTARFVTEYPNGLIDFDNYLADFDVEIIGNIHDNSELLKSEV